MLLPKLSYHFCDTILPARVQVPRLIDHNPLGADDDDREDRYKRTLRRYRKAFGIEPPSLFWEDPEEEEDEEEEEEGEEDDEEEEEEEDDNEEEEEADENARKRARLEYDESDDDHNDLPDENNGSSQIFMKTHTQGTLSIKINLATTTVAQLKVIIQRINGMPLDQQRIIFAGKQLEDSRTLADYNVQKECTLHLIYRMKGC